MSTEVKVPETLEEAQELLKTAREEKEAAEARAIGAEKVIEKHKKNPKEPGSDDKFSKEDVEKLLSDRDFKAKENDFYAQNPDLVEHKDKLTEYTSKGISIEQAKILVEQDDPTIANRKNISKANFTAGDPGIVAKTITQAEMGKLSPAEFKIMWAQVKEGKVRVI